MPNELIMDNLHIILEAIELIEQRSSRVSSPNEFVENSNGILLLDSISMRLQVIGESIKKIEKIDSDFLKSYTEVKWEQIIRLRDLVSHHYDRIDHEIVYDICKYHIPELKITITKMLNA